MNSTGPAATPPIEAIEIRLLSLPTRSTLAAAHDASPAEDRELAVVGVTDRFGTTGWGECSALNTASYWPETARSSFAALDAFARQGHSLQALPMAQAALEMATLDLSLRSAGRSLADHLGVTASSVGAGAVVGLGSIGEVTAQVEGLIVDGFRRIKLKIQPGNDIDVVRSVRAAWPDIEIQVDANGSYQSTNSAPLRALLDLGVTIFEQPFDWRTGDLESPRSLIADGAVVFADEAVTTTAELIRHADAGAASGVVVKSSRLGGLAAALAFISLAESVGLGVSAGGMLESGLGRHVLAALAALPANTAIGDVSPARRWLAADPWSDVTMIDGQVLVPIGPGVAPLPDLDLLDRYTITRSSTR